MSTNTAEAFYGFTVFQSELGASLVWLPAMGTKELNAMINTYLPGPSSIQDKISLIVMDFSEYRRLTGDNLKVYAIPTAPSFSTATSSPASSALMYDAGYASNFSTSPVVAESQWAESPSTSSIVSFDETSARSSSTSKRTSASSSKPRANDFANHPGMRIMTKDGRDITNSASRGSKTKEQRDHAHLMRIIKACDSCRKKKVRCDPSHKKRNASQASAAQVEQKSARKPKKQAAVAAKPPPTPSTNEFSIDPDSCLDFLSTETFDYSSFDFPTFETTPESNDLWDQFIQQDPTLLTNDPMNYVPDDYSLFTDHQLSHFSPSAGSSSTSPSQGYTPYTPTPPGPSPDTVVYENISDISPGDPTLPYLNPGVAHGTDYVDFNLFSSPRDFALDEELQPIKKSSGQRSTQATSPVNGVEILDNVAATSPQAGGIVFSASPGVPQPPVPCGRRVSHRPAQTAQAITSPAAVFQDYSPALETAATQQSYSPGQQCIGRLRPGLEGYERIYGDGVRATGSGPEQSSGVIAQSTVTAPVRCAAGNNFAGADVTVSPSLAIVASPSVVAPSPSVPVSTTMAPGWIETTQARANASGLPGVSSVTTGPQVSRRGVGDAQATVKPATVQTFGNVSASGLAGPSTSVQYGVGAQTQGFVPSGVDANVFVATTLLSFLPVRRSQAGVGDKSSIVSSQLVVLGLVSYLLVCLVGSQQSMGSLYDVVSTLIMITAVSLTVLSTNQNRSSGTNSAKPTLSTSLVENVKSKVQAAGCRVRQQTNLFTRRSIFIPRLASVSLHGRV
ncbi:hypothetical protein V8F20_010541 [Naviculisporaceae sp. PSN 640]